MVAVVTHNAYYDLEIDGKIVFVKVLRVDDLMVLVWEPESGKTHKIAIAYFVGVAPIDSTAKPKRLVRAYAKMVFDRVICRGK